MFRVLCAGYHVLIIMRECVWMGVLSSPMLLLVKSNKKLSLLNSRLASGSLNILNFDVAFISLPVISLQFEFVYQAMADSRKLDSEEEHLLFSADDPARVEQWYPRSLQNVETQWSPSSHSSPPRSRFHPYIF